jgi:hypothetical protein
MSVEMAQVDAKRLPQKQPLRAGVCVIVGCVAMLALAEVGAKAILRISRIQRRTTSEIAAATRMHGGTINGIRRVLILGNSLLLEGVDFSVLQHGLGPQIELGRLVVEQTFYLDWYYGLRKLFAAGSRPDLIVLKLNAVQLLDNGIRGDYSANRLFAAADLLGVAHGAGLSATQASSLWFAHYSTFYGNRAEIRTWLLWSLIPQLEELTPHLGRFRPPHLTRGAILRAAPARLGALRQMAASCGVGFVLLVPATLAVDDETTALIEAGRRAGVVVLAPVAQGVIPPYEFSDGFHLNSAGAQRYSAALVPVLKRAALDWQP